MKDVFLIQSGIQGQADLDQTPKLSQHIFQGNNLVNQFFGTGVRMAYPYLVV